MSDPVARRVPAPGRTRLIACLLLTAGVLSGCELLGRSDEGDARITAEVRALFAQHAELQPPTLLDVQTVQRVVYLHGVVATPFELGMAASVAGQVPGVAHVVNLIGLDNSR